MKLLQIITLLTISLFIGSVSAAPQPIKVNPFTMSNARIAVVDRDNTKVKEDAKAVTDTEGDAKTVTKCGGDMEKKDMKKEETKCGADMKKKKDSKCGGK